MSLPGITGLETSGSSKTSLKGSSSSPQTMRRIDLKSIPIEILMNSEQDLQDSEYQKSGLIKIREEFEKRILLNVLEAAQGNQTEAAKILKINRNTLIQKARQFGILLKKESSKLP